MLALRSSTSSSLPGLGCEEAIEDVDDTAARVPNVPRARAAGKKILIMVTGTRGDIQPIIALGKALKQAGFVVKFGTNEDHVEFVKKGGLDAVETAQDFEKFMNSEELRAPMATGSMLSMLKAGEIMADNALKTAPKSFAQKVELIRDFQPDVMILETKDVYDSVALANHFRIPTVMQYLYPMMMPSKDVTSFCGEPSWAPHRILGTLMIRMLQSSDKDGRAGTMLEQMPDIEPSMMQSLRERMVFHMNPIAPALIGVSPRLCGVPSDWTEELKRHTHITGFWVVGKEEQRRGLQRSDSKFGGASLDALTDFLARGDAPVYIGWGSMIVVSGEYMTCLAVRALMKSRSRGVVLGGWAKLDAAMMQGQPDTPQMVEYARENVLFLKTAPHEWLFPQCACTVHHGGAGTTAAALRAGKPTIITPVIGDQFWFANKAAEAGVGIEMKQLSKVTADALARAISEAKAPAMHQAASAMGEGLRAEDGLGNAVKVLDTWIMEDVVTGKYKEAYEAREAMVGRMRAQGEPGCLWWVGRLWCGGDAANSYTL